MGSRIPALQAVEIEINHACNRACSYCPNSVAERRSKGVMSLETYQTILDQLAEVHFAGRISYDFYNEPLLHPQLIEIVRRTREQLPETKIHIYTNGTMLSLEKINQLFKAGVSQFVVTRHEEDEEGSKAERYLFESVYAQLSEEQKAKVLYRSHHDLKLVNRGGLLPHIAEEGLALTPCFIPSHMLTVMVDGRVLSCFEDFNENLVFGDLKKEKLVDIWEKHSYKILRENLQKGLRHLHTPCKNCNRGQALPPFDV